MKTLTAAAQSKPATSSASVQSNPGNTQRSQLCLFAILFDAKEAVLLFRQSGQQTGVAAKKSTIQPLMGKNLTGYAMRGCTISTAFSKSWRLKCHRYSCCV